MTKEAQVYRDKINQLEGQLTQENREYFSDLRVYMTLAGAFVDEAELNLQLYQMETDLLAAQADGISAVDFFGNQPQEMADELLRHTQKASSRSLLGMLLMVVSILWGINLLGDFSVSGEVTLSLLRYLASALLGILGLGLLFWILKRSVFTAGVAPLKSLKSQIAGGAVFLGVIVGQVTVNRLLVDAGLIRIAFPFALLLLGGLGLILTVALVKTKEALFYPLGFFLYVLLGTGLLQRLLAVGLLSGSYWQVIQTVALVVAGVIGLFWQMRLNREK